ncbi:P-loop containing nucleoside triphosphate hydrolase protein [Durotheca rogersii]|uniref:P-loop containing nucleoside triphosphate hydrolase protein n=1 Tax=Durotheca rogersii TaxID=419775 RepID=UPI00221FF3C2|nr:P-loop containing nucleoside triphosphate hydrolase protein [Durotheca rogersii]KAI5855570.1 P-loop containing nucleoside triphosphate hydrolase protein [Durotheca rogersii]
MRLLFSTPICPSCLFTAKTRNALHILRLTSSPWAARRFLSNRVRTGSAPSRMVLSNRVARFPGSDTQARGGRKPGWRSPGPFGGMNQTFAPPRESAMMRTPRPGEGRPLRDRDDPKRYGGRGREERGKDHGPRTKAMRMQGALATVSYGYRTRTKQNIAEIVSFDQLKLLPSVTEALFLDVLKGLVDVKPTPIQRLAIPALLNPRSVRGLRDKGHDARHEFLLAAETGSGKTLAYLLPVIDALKRQEAADPAIAAYREKCETLKQHMQTPGYTGPREFDPHPTTARPRAIVLVPTAELVDQIGGIAKAMSHVVKYKAVLLSAKISATVINASMYTPKGIDLIVSTPHLLSSIADSDPYILSRVTHLVVDEADSLFDRSFSHETTSIIDRALPSLKQLILCSATITKKLDSYLESNFPDMTRMTTPNLHAIPRRVQLGVLDVNQGLYHNNKNVACADIIWGIGKKSIREYEPVKRAKTPGAQEPGAQEPATGELTTETTVMRIIVFVNEREMAKVVADYLVTKGIDAIALHRDTPERRQSEMLDAFKTTGSMPLKHPPIPEPGKGLRVLPNVKVIVATDLASRGIDTTAVRHVILYDVPHTTIDFIHRLGRAGRMGRRGRGIVLVGRGDRQDIVAEVRDNMFNGKALI